MKVAPGLDAMVVPRVHELVIAAACLTGVPVQMIYSPNRGPRAAQARFAVAWAARAGLGYSTSQTARALKRTDHSTIVNALQRAELLRADDPEFHRVSDLLLSFIQRNAR